MRGLFFSCAAFVMGSFLIAACVGDAPGGASNDAGGNDGGSTGDGSALDGSSGDDGSKEAAPTCTDASDTSSDPSNCGRCGRACGATFNCNNGHCGDEVVEVAAAATFGCMRLHGGSVYCWGANDDAQLGLEPSAADNSCGASHCRATPQRIAGITAASRVVAAYATACVIESGVLKCWGGNPGGILAQPTSLTHSATPIQVQFPASDAGAVSIAQVSVNASTACAVSTAGDLYCWGSNTWGEAGQAPSTSVGSPTLVPGFNHDVALVSVGMDAASGGHTCAIRTDKTMWCWGSNQNGEDGFQGGPTTGCPNSYLCDPTPTQVSGLSNVTAISTGPGSSCALTDAVKCFGGNSYGELGELTTTYTPTPKTIPGLPTNAVKQLAQGAWSQFGITGAGDVWAWGIVNSGSLGDGASTGVTCGNLQCRANGAVEQVAGLAGTKQVSFSEVWGLALKQDGSVVAWGGNAFANLGHLPGPASGDDTCGSSACHPLPVQVTSP